MAVALGAELNTTRPDIAITVAVFDFITGHMINNDAVDVYRTVATGGAGDETRHVNRVITMIRWPQLDDVVVQRNRRRCRIYS